MPDKKSKKNGTLGILFWVAFILLIIVLFFLKKSNISETLNLLSEKNSSNGGVTKTEQPDAPTTSIQQDSSGDIVVSRKDDAQTQALSPEPVAPKPAATVTETPTKVSPTEPASQSAPTPAAAAKPSVTPEKPTAPKKTTTTTAAKTTAKTTTAAVATRKATVFFVKIDDDGKVIRQQTSREVPKTDSPLAETLDALFKGPSATESAKGYRSLIPQGTRLLSTVVKDGVATVNVSEAFQFNQFGIEGYLGQLSQIVFTATAFPTVTSVQFLIEGQRREYLGAEGVWIGTPLSRDKF